MSKKKKVIAGAALIGIFGVVALVLFIVGGVKRSVAANWCESTCSFNTAEITTKQQEECCSEWEEDCWYNSDGEQQCTSYCVDWDPCCDIDCTCTISVPLCAGKRVGSVVNSTRETSFNPWGLCSSFDDTFCIKEHCDTPDEAWTCWVEDEAEPDGTYDTHDTDWMLAGLVLVCVGAGCLLPVLIGAGLVLYVFRKRFTFFKKLFSTGSSRSSSSSSSSSSFGTPTGAAGPPPPSEISTVPTRYPSDAYPAVELYGQPEPYSQPAPSYPGELLNS